MGILIHGFALGMFLGLGALAPRNKQQGLIHSDLVINVVTGMAIFVCVKPVTDWIANSLNFHLWELPTQNSAFHFLFAFILIDFARYALHYAHHRVPFLWHFHRVHHSSEVLDSTSGLRMHIVDFLQLAMLPIVLFGVLLDTREWADWVLPFAMGIGVFFDAFQHANLRFNVKRPVQRLWHMLFNNPHFHVWHHTRDGKLCDGNYGNSLLVWDRIFGTEVTKDHVPPLLGIAEDQSLQNDPLSLQLLRRK